MVSKGWLCHPPIRSDTSCTELHDAISLKSTHRRCDASVPPGASSNSAAGSVMDGCVGHPKKRTRLGCPAPSLRAIRILSPSTCGGPRIIATSVWPPSVAARTSTPACTDVSGSPLHPSRASFSSSLPFPPCNRRPMRTFCRTRLPSMPLRTLRLHSQHSSDGRESGCSTTSDPPPSSRCSP